MRSKAPAIKAAPLCWRAQTWVPADSWSFFSVNKQAPAAGTLVEARQCNDSSERLKSLDPPVSQTDSVVNKALS